MADENTNQRWMMIEGQEDKPPFRCRFESISRALPQRIQTTSALMGNTRHHPNIKLEQLTGIHERRICSAGEDSFTSLIETTSKVV